MQRLLIGAAAALLLVGCASTDTAEVTDAATVSATVAAVDPAARTIALVTDGGETIRLTATPEMRNFDQIEPGDVATLEIYGSVQVRVAGADAPAEPQTLAVLGRAPEGARPGAVAGMITTATLEFVAYDPATHEAALILPDGEPIVVPVQPEMRAFAAARTPGERIEVTFSDAVALLVEPAA
jgi:hypothetical protein